MTVTDTVKITCYGSEREYERKQALKEFKNAMYGCDENSHEHMRYEYIYECLLNGDTVIDDDNV